MKWVVVAVMFLTSGVACFLVGYGMGALALDVDWTRPRRTFRDELDGQDAGA